MTFKIAYYIPGSIYGGAHNQVCAMAPELKAQGFEEVIILPREPGDAADRLEENGLRVIRGTFLRPRATLNVVVNIKAAANFIPQTLRLMHLLKRDSVELLQIYGLMCIDG